jgi:hypothetical protein
MGDATPQGWAWRSPPMKKEVSSWLASKITAWI